MMTNNLILYGTKITAEFIRDILFFPLWWYSQGLWQLIKKIMEFLNNRQKAMALLVWIKNLFRPMYGQYDWQGFLISFFIRLVMIIFKGIAMIFWCLLALAVLAAWLGLPLLVVYQIIFQING